MMQIIAVSHPLPNPPRRILLTLETLPDLHPHQDVPWAMISYHHPDHAGLRYHGNHRCLLVHEALWSQEQSSNGYSRVECFALRTEGYSAQKLVMYKIGIDEALKCKKTGEEKILL